MIKQLVLISVTTGSLTLPTGQQPQTEKLASAQAEQQQQESQYGAAAPSPIKTHCLRLNRTAFENNWTRGSMDDSLQQCIADKTKQLPEMAKKAEKTEDEFIKHANGCLTRKTTETEFVSCVSGKDEAKKETKKVEAEKEEAKKEEIKKEEAKKEEIKK